MFGVHGPKVLHVGLLPTLGAWSPPVTLRAWPEYCDEAALVGRPLGILMAVGILRLVMAIQHRAMQGWGWVFFGGVVTVLLGLMILARWPLDALWVIGLFLAVELIVNGWSGIFLALAARAAGRGMAAGAV